MSISINSSAHALDVLRVGGAKLSLHLPAQLIERPRE
jgi:hypothetical protein